MVPDKNAATSGELVQLVQEFTRKEGDFESGIQGLTIHVRNAPTEPLHCIYTLSLAVVLQGGKELLQENDVTHCHAGQAMLTTFDLPVVSHVSSASRYTPFIALILKLDYSLILQTCAELKLSKPPRDMKFQALSSYDVDDGLLDALKRLLMLEKQPSLMAGLLPLIEKEIVVRLLDSPHGMHLRHMAALGSPNGNVLKAVTWLKQNFAQTINMNELAEQAHMSASTFRQHFKALTGTSPLQYLKTLRLQEARDQMLVKGVDATLASNLVGYESASQFSREYSRLFGLPPQKDIQRLRQLHQV
ncbi:AraC family transcriptional regulator [Pseudoalteromonas xiamenensis]|uniref:AraC family transcriptional regulator n=1 Tax=Pseudoalteromonas xiamenensis TaxID=882626 RepID=A0A975DL75_9GAMM|nr:AraC family transcriptional regulator [Pseudoalteromonas xiamenensis]QTH73564.1 AraC family transcriptional regulator [Pseudoalteromonas xiamenensis]